MNRKRAAWLLTASTIVWSSAYLFMKMGLESIGPFNIAALRFGLAFLLLCPTLLRKRALLTKRLIAYSAVCGVFIAIIAGLIATGLKSTTSSNAGFLVGLTVIFVPLIEAVLKRRRPDNRILLGAVLALIGIGLLTLKGDFSFNPGDILCALAGFLYAVQVIITDRGVQRDGCDGYCLGVAQLLFAGLAGFFASCLFETPAWPTGLKTWLAVAGLVVLCTAFGFVVPPIAQKHLSASQAGIIFALEPLCTAILGAIFLEERLAPLGYLGGVLLLFSVVFTQVERKGAPAEPLTPSDPPAAGENSPKTLE